MKKKTKADLDKQEIAGRIANQKRLKAEAGGAYQKKKTWDFGRLGTKQVLDTTRMTERKKK